MIDTAVEVEIEGQKFKIGFRGLVYVWRNDEWKVSARSASEVCAAINRLDSSARSRRKGCQKIM